MFKYLYIHRVFFYLLIDIHTSICTYIYKYLPNFCRLTDIDHTLDLMDFDGSDDLDINEFFEVR
jgi:hypothetical protein